MAMAQTIVTLCDECLAAGAEVVGEPYGLTIEVPGARSVAWVLDACERHAKPIQDMRAALAEHGRRADRNAPLPVTTSKPRKTSAEPGPVARPNDCPVCGSHSASRTALNSHTRRAHGQTLAAIEGQDLAPCPVGCGQTVTTKPQGLSAHLRGNAHGMSRAEAREAVAARAR